MGALATLHPAAGSRRLAALGGLCGLAALLWELPARPLLWGLRGLHLGRRLAGRLLLWGLLSLLRGVSRLPLPALAGGRSAAAGLSRRGRGLLGRLLSGLAAPRRPPGRLVLGVRGPRVLSWVSSHDSCRRALGAR